MEEKTSRNFIEEIIDGDLESGRTQRVVTRFPPEPNGYLHLGHAKAISVDFGLAEKYGGSCNLRFDDTNPVKEDTEYIDAIKRDIEWLGYRWERECYGSDYFQYMYERAVDLIRNGLAYVDDLTPEQMREYRGTLTEPGRESPYRSRTPEENLELFERMKNGEFPDGSRVLRAKIDMASPNLNMRDPAIYRIVHAEHHRTGSDWVIYPMYDFAHPLEDAAEGITHSLCTMEFEDHRPLYDWVVEHAGVGQPPHQYEFARLNLSNTVMSKRYLKKLVDDGVVEGWDDPRMPTISGIRRRGYTPEAVRDFCERIGVAKAVSEVDIRLLEHCVRSDLNEHADRLMAVLDPVKLTITNYPDGQTEMMEAENLPGSGRTHEMPFSKHLYIEREDFREERPNKKYFRLYKGGEVRLKNAYIIKCEDIIKDADGRITEILCTYDPDSKSGMPGADRKVKGTLHWVDQEHAVPARVRIYDALFTENELGEKDLNPESKRELNGVMVEPEIRHLDPGARLQFMRQGYFVQDSVLSSPDSLVFNKVVGLKDSYKPPAA
ncbi:MAG: glutamine--tRNA ligase/YqeY domain fusion protein [Clostridia bacterium]|nr:glutamine--tRNA ligase/YqeY domain fusion protein [Clostridia bacterium]